MNILLTLVKKEVLGVFWKTIALAAIALATVLAAPFLSYGGPCPKTIEEGLILALAGQAILGGLFLSMHASAVEHADGTIDFTRSLPAPIWWFGAVRILVAALALVVPMVLCGEAAEVLLWKFRAPGSVPELSIWKTIGLASLGALNFYLWNTALGMNQRTELRAAAIGVAILVVTLGVALWNDRLTPPMMLTPLSVHYWTPPLGSAPGMGRVIRERAIAGQLVYAVLNPLLLWAAIRRYAGGGLAAVPVLRPEPRKPGLTWAWFHLAEAWPLGLVSLALAGLLLHVAVNDSPPTIGVFSGLGGTVWGLVAGVALFISDLEPRLSAFWRSRPIPPQRWFWTKFWTGWLMLVLIVDAPLIVTSFLRPGLSSLLIVLFHTAAYAIAVLCTCLVRQPIYSGVFAFCLTMILVGVLACDLPHFRVLLAVQRLNEVLTIAGALDSASIAVLVVPALTGAAAVITAIVLTARWAVLRDIHLGRE